MSVDFIKKGVNQNYIFDATKQQDDIRYFVESKIQKDITTEYITTWVQSKYATNDSFFNWLKTVLKSDNFLSVFKHLRFPLPSARLINDEIKPQLKRIFHAEDSYEKYVIRGKEINDPLDSTTTNSLFFDAFLFRFNDILIHDLEYVNKPYRYILDIDKVISIDVKNNKITRIAFNCLRDDQKGITYLDAEKYCFYDENYNEIVNELHDLGVCPADFISDETFGYDNEIVRRSIFSYVKNDLEEFVFLKALQRMADVNGTIPVVTQLMTAEKKFVDAKTETDKEPITANSMASQRSSEHKTFAGSNSPMQAGTIISVPQLKKEDGSLDMDMVKNFVNFFYLPVECLEFINLRIKETELNIIKSLLGTTPNENTTAKNETQIKLSFVSKQDRLRDLAMSISKLRNSSDSKMLGLQYGNKNIEVDIFLGSDFFIETEKEVHELYALSPNPIERKKLLIKASQSKNRFNKTKADREKLLYDLLPYADDKDFDKALSNSLVSDENKKLQTQFYYYISLFEANYGDILMFYNNLLSNDSEKIIIINNLLLNLIQNNI